MPSMNSFEDFDFLDMQNLTLFCLATSGDELEKIKKHKKPKKIQRHNKQKKYEYVCFNS